jgi:hypothetical protein
MYRNELLSKLVEGAKPFAYTANVLKGVPEGESQHTKQWRIRINEDLGDEFLRRESSFNHSEKIYPTFYASNFDDLYSNLFGKKAN